jgi:hypothetical protein
LNKVAKNIIGLMMPLVFLFSFGQERIITGKIIGQELTEFPGVVVMDSDTEKVLDTTNFDGKFEFKYSSDIKKIKFIFVMTQEEEIEISESCNHIELILLEEWIYDFVSLKTAERKKRRDRKRILPKLYAEAYENGIFKNKKSCR